MVRWKNKAEYEKWKAEKSSRKTIPQQSQPEESTKKQTTSSSHFMNIDIEKLPPLVKIFLIFIAVVITIIIIYGDKSEKESAGKWYSGGTLHDKTLKEWYNASYKNRLATSADFITSATPENKHSLLFKNNMNVLKYRASSLEKCITDSSKGLDEIYVMKIAESATACFILLKF